MKRRAITEAKYERLGIWTVTLACGHTRTKVARQDKGLPKTALCPNCK